jgi:hypothetical protein
MIRKKQPFLQQSVRPAIKKDIPELNEVDQEQTRERDDGKLLLPEFSSN